MPSGNLQTIPVGAVSNLIQADIYHWGALMAAALLGSVPLVIDYSFFIDNDISGLTAGATKG